VDLMVYRILGNKFVLWPWCCVFFVGITLGYESSVGQFEDVMGVVMACLDSISSSRLVLWFWFSTNGFQGVAIN